MKIDSFKSPFVNTDTKSTSEARNKDKAGARLPDAAPAEETAKGDTVQLSDRSRLVARAQELASGAPEVREDKVNDLRDRISAGTYNVSGQTVASSMLRKSITEV